MTNAKPTLPEQRVRDGVKQAEKGNPGGEAAIEQARKVDPAGAEAMEQEAADGPDGRGLSR